MNDQKWGAAGSANAFHACGCIGPQNGQPLCPCRMRGVKIVNGRYVQVNDLGPAHESDVLAKRFETGAPLIGQDPIIGN